MNERPFQGTVEAWMRCLGCGGGAGVAFGGSRVYSFLVDSHPSILHGETRALSFPCSILMGMVFSDCGGVAFVLVKTWINPVFSLHLLERIFHF